VAFSIRSSRSRATTSLPDDVDRALGNLDADRMYGLVVAVGDGDPAGILAALDEAFEAGRDAEEILRQLLETYREAMSATARGSMRASAAAEAHVVDAAREGIRSIVYFIAHVFFSTRGAR
jgi:DNA polymerase III gamma/tau subunit